MSSSDTSKPRPVQNTFNRDETAAELLSLYEFLVTMFLPDDAIRHPPPRGYPKVTKERLAFLEKDDTVIDLLRHLPYLKYDGHHNGVQYHGYNILEDTHANDYAGISFHEDTFDLSGGRWPSDVSRGNNEDVEDDVHEVEIPSHFATICSPAAKYGWWVWVDTRNGKVEMLLNIYGGKKYFESVHEWCEWMKGEYRALRVVPQSTSRVEEIQEGSRRKNAAAGHFRRHGWPDSPTYDKTACLADVEADEDVISW